MKRMTSEQYAQAFAAWKAAKIQRDNADEAGFCWIEDRAYFEQAF